MVISRTPLRVSFVGGGSDIMSFSREHGGAVLSTTIGKYVNVIVSERFEEDIRVSYSKTEIVLSIDDLEHELARETLRVAGLRRQIEIVMIADVPSEGSGLGSSSAATVGLLNALYAYQGILKSPEELALEAARIEIDVLEKPIGKQDQYAAAYGGFQFLEFGPGEAVHRHPLVLTPEHHDDLNRRLLIFHTGKPSRGEGLTELAGPKTLAEAIPTLEALRDHARMLFNELSQGADTRVLGEYLHEAWMMKRELPQVTDDEIDEWYNRARTAGAVGGKLLGSGAGGFMLFYVPEERQAKVRAALSDLRELPFSLESEGSRIVQVGR